MKEVSRERVRITWFRSTLLLSHRGTAKGAGSLTVQESQYLTIDGDVSFIEFERTVVTRDPLHPQKYDG